MLVTLQHVGILMILVGGVMWFPVMMMVASVQRDTVWSPFVKGSKYWFIIGLLLALSPFMYEWAH